MLRSGRHGQRHQHRLLAVGRLAPGARPRPPLARFRPPHFLSKRCRHHARLCRLLSPQPPRAPTPTPRSPAGACSTASSRSKPPSSSPSVRGPQPPDADTSRAHAPSPPGASPRRSPSCGRAPEPPAPSPVRPRQTLEGWRRSADISRAPPPPPTPQTTSAPPPRPRRPHRPLPACRRGVTARPSLSLSAGEGSDGRADPPPTDPPPGRGTRLTTPSSTAIRGTRPSPGPSSCPSPATGPSPRCPSSPATTGRRAQGRECLPSPSPRALPPRRPRSGGLCCWPLSPPERGGMPPGGASRARRRPCPHLRRTARVSAPPAPSAPPASQARPPATPPPPLPWHTRPLLLPDGPAPPPSPHIHTIAANLTFPGPSPFTFAFAAGYHTYKIVRPLPLHSSPSPRRPVAPAAPSGGALICSNSNN